MGNRSPWMSRAWGVLALGVVGAAFGVAIAQPRVGTTLTDFYAPGTQPTAPGPLLAPIEEPQVCGGCHGEFDLVHAPYERWRYSMMAHATRDPIFQSQLQVAEQDASFSGDTCLRCHTPAGWVQKRNRPTDGTGLNSTDLHGVSCHVCHRMVDPDSPPRSLTNDPAPRPGAEYGQDAEGAPEIDAQLLAALGPNRPPTFVAENGRPGGALNANTYIIDTQDRRRGPYELGPDFLWHQWLESPFHRKSQQCASCHDISNTAFTRLPDNTYVLNALDTRHPTADKYDMFPLDRLYSEWAKSEFANGPVTLTVPDPNGGAGTWGRYAFDGVTRVDPETPGSPLLRFNTATGYSSCQDCHMPRTTGEACIPALGPPTREDTMGVPVHNFSGSNTWVLKSVADMYPSNEIQLPGLPPPDELRTDMATVDEALARVRHNRTMASDTELTRIGAKLRVRVVNQTGHKLPSGFSEGRRLWLNVKFFGPGNTLISERGAYDAANATLTTANTKVYEAKAGLDAVMAAMAGLPEGPSFHLDINNVRMFDNRIPPRGFTNAGFQAVQAEPVGYEYDDGQYWDDTIFDLPTGVVRVEVRLFGQTTTREYAEFLRDNATSVQDPAAAISIPQPGPNTWTAPAGTPPPPLSLGQITYAQWVKWGKSEPVEMDSVAAPAVNCPADVASLGGNIGGDGLLTADDIIVFLDAFFSNNLLVADIAQLGGAQGGDGQLTADDIIFFLDAFFRPCP
ncbi:MAG: GC-type dockerin domain-anchored protein [Phycisphaerales bacterium]